MTRYVTHEGVTWTGDDSPPESTPDEPTMEEVEERFRLYRLCTCVDCKGTGKDAWHPTHPSEKPGGRCKACRGEGRALDLVATATSPEAVGVALITLGREGEWADCPVGILDTLGDKHQKWLVSPWLPSARNVSDAGRTLRSARTA